LNAREYYLSLQKAIHAAPHVLRSDVRFEEIDVNECYTLAFVGTIPLEANER